MAAGCVASSLRQSTRLVWRTSCFSGPQGGKNCLSGTAGFAIGAGASSAADRWPLVLSLPLPR